MSTQPPENCGHDSGSPITTDQESVEWAFITEEPEEDMIEADQDSVEMIPLLAEKPVEDKPRRELPPLLFVQPSQPATRQRPQSGLNNHSALLRSRRWPRPETKSPDANDGDATWSHLWSLSEFHLKAIDDAYKLENWKLSEELTRTEEQLEEQAADLVRRRSQEINRYIEYVQAIHHRMEDDGETIRSLREKLKDAGIKDEKWKDIDALLVDLEDSHAQSSEDIIDVAFQFQKDIDEGGRNVY